MTSEAAAAARVAGNDTREEIMLKTFANKNREDSLGQFN